MPPRLLVIRESVRKVCQLTGEKDRQIGQNAFNQTETRFGLFGTDLGSSFEHGGRLWFLFGDTWSGPGPGNDQDSIAWTNDANADAGIRLTFLNRNQKYVSPVLKNQAGATMSTAGFEVPIHGFSANSQIYIFYSTDHFQEHGQGGALDAFWIACDGAVIANWASPGVDGARWHQPARITGPNAARADSPIAVVTRFDGAIDVFWIGPDGAVATTWANPGIDDGNWHAPFPITPPGVARRGSPLAVVTRLDGALDAFWLGSDNAVATTSANPGVDNATWHLPFPITPPGAARGDSPLAAVTRLEGALDMFWIGPDGAVATTWANPEVDNAAWHLPFPITPPAAARSNSPLAVVTRLEGALAAFWIGPDGAVATTWANPEVDNAAWHPPFPITPPAAARSDSPLAVITRLEGALAAFWIGPDGAVGTTWANPDNAIWHPPFPITPPGATRDGSAVAVLTRFAGALDVFWTGPDGAVGTTWANPDVDNAIWHPPFPISFPATSRPVNALAAITRRNHARLELMGTTVLAKAIGNDPTNLAALYDMSRLDQGGKFINVACVPLLHGMRGLPFNGPAILAWGSGRYRDSDVFFGAIPFASVQDPSAWRFFTGIGADGVTPQWSVDQKLSAPLFLQRQVGELSAGFIEPLDLWLMLYNAGAPRGINARVAQHPWGPWSDVTVLFDPGWPGVGYGHFMHVKGGADPMSDPGRENEWGGEYGPYLIGRYTRPENDGPQGAKRAGIFFVMSTWNPYNTVLMSAVIERSTD
jgi:hypothetical protein